MTLDMFTHAYFCALKKLSAALQNIASGLFWISKCPEVPYSICLVSNLFSYERKGEKG